MGILTRWMLNAIALFVTVWLGQQFGLELALKPPIYAFVAVIALAIVNTLIRPIIKLLTLPLNCLTLGILGIVINALFFWMVGSIRGTGLQVNGFLAGLFGSVVYSFLSVLVNRYVKKRGEETNNWGNQTKCNW